MKTPPKPLGTSIANRLTFALMIGLFGMTLLACNKTAAPPAQAEVLGRNQVCALDGMILMNYDGPKAQLLLKDGRRQFFCDTKEIFTVLLDPVRSAAVQAAWFQTLDDHPWNYHTDGWSLGDSLWYVSGSDLQGSMGPCFAPFESKDSAEKFAATNKGKVLPYREITMDLIHELGEQGMRMLGGGQE